MENQQENTDNILTLELDNRPIHSNIKLRINYLSFRCRLHAELCELVCGIL